MITSSISSAAAIAALEDVTIFPGQWSVEKANAWYTRQPFLVGCNYIPSNAVNELEMWQSDTWSPEVIDRELGWAADLGMNMARVFLHNLAYEQDPQGYFDRLEHFLQIADKHRIKIMFVLFDSCWNDDPVAGPQPQPKAGVHNSGWLRCPGSKMLFDSSTWHRLEAYTKDTITRFGNDPRVLVWDIYNEPSNSGYTDEVMPLLKKSFEWARAVQPSQPITSGWWNDHSLSNEFMFANSDIITFHNYLEPHHLELQIQELQKRFRRPVICTEYMARTNKSTFEGSLPIFKRYKVGAINWGLVQGKTNTIYAWNQPIFSGEEPALWFHDIFRSDGSIYNQQEVNAIREATGRKSGGADPLFIPEVIQEENFDYSVAE